MAEFNKKLTEFKAEDEEDSFNKEQFRIGVIRILKKFPQIALTMLNSIDGRKNNKLNVYHESYENTLNQFQIMLS